MKAFIEYASTREPFKTHYKEIFDSSLTPLINSFPKEHPEIDKAESVFNPPKVALPNKYLFDTWKQCISEPYLVFLTFDKMLIA
jgi:hypothetical protein